MPLQTHISSDLFLHVPPSPGQAQSALTQQPVRIVFFITGNPGLIAYYHTFLSLLASSEEARGCVIYGASLGGFEIEAKVEGNQDVIGAVVENLLFPRAIGERGEGKSWGLREQVELCMARVDELVRRIGAESSVDEDRVNRRRPIKVILMGHSVGAWIALEMIRCSQARQEQLPMAETILDRGSKRSEDDKDKPGATENDQDHENWEVEAAMLLTPTIMDLPLSNSGRIAGPLLGNVPYLPELTQWGSVGVKWLIGERWLRSVVSSITGMRENEGSGLDTTVKFLQSGHCVKQSLCLAKDELSIIREDAWGEDVWGVLNERPVESARAHNKEAIRSDRKKYAKLYFLFAEKDHWVADGTRKKIFETRGKADLGHRCVLDEKGLQHAWCLRQNAEVADRVKGWLQEITGSQT